MASKHTQARRVEMTMRRLTRSAEREVRAVAADLTRAIANEVSRQGSGRLYRSRKTVIRRGVRVRSRQWHRASAPGEPPARDTGQYMRGWRHRIPPGDQRKTLIRREVLNLVGAPGVSVPRVQLFERGTSKMAPRPHVGVVFRRMRRRLLDRLRAPSILKGAGY